MKKMIQLGAVLTVALATNSAYAQSDLLAPTKAITQKNSANTYTKINRIIKSAETHTTTLNKGCNCEICQMARDYRL